MIEFYEPMIKHHPNQISETAAEKLLVSLANPANTTLVHWRSPNPLISQRESPLNKSQHAALESLKSDLELIRGPPATGKSTTILALATGTYTFEDKSSEGVWN